MAATPSRMVPLGSPMPSFALPNAVDGRKVSSSTLVGKPSVVIFICNHCPFVKHIRRGLADFGRYCRDRGVAMVAINCNDTSAYPEDAPPRMADEAARVGYVFPYLFDESQAVARAFGARCTPDLYIFDAEGKLAYRGQFDGARPGSRVPVTGDDARAAVDALLTGQGPSTAQKPSIGCSIKWKPGNEPT